jgi:Galactose oxidase, central domain
MPATILHMKTLTIGDDPINTQLVRPSDWNSIHKVTLQFQNTDIVQWFSAGTSSISSGTLVFNNANNVSFSMSAGTITASFAMTQPAVSAAGSSMGGNNVVIFDQGNSSQVAFAMSGSTITAAFPFLANTFSGTFTATIGTPTTPRYLFTATKLNDGTVLITGGYNTNSLNTAEIYDPSTGQFTATANNMTSARWSHTATLLNDGTVLIAGGYNDTNVLATAEIYNPVGQTFTPIVSQMSDSRGYHTATLLQSGLVLLAGGQDDAGNILNTADLYTTGSQTFAPTSGNMTIQRCNHIAALLNTGKVLVAGGDTVSPFVAPPMSPIQTAETFDPTSSTFTATVNQMTQPREAFTSTLLNSGKVLLTGGLYDSATHVTATADIYDPSANTFVHTAGSMIETRESHAASLLSNGWVLISGGYNGSSSVVSQTAEIYNPGADMFTMVGTMTIPRVYQKSVTLNDGTVLVIDGRNLGGVLQSAELFTLVLQGIAAGGSTVGSGTVSFANSNNVSFGFTSNTITGSVAFTVPSISAAGASASAGTIVFSNSNSVSFGMNGSTVTMFAGPPNFAISASTTSQNSGTIVFSNNTVAGISFGMVGSTITASYGDDNTKRNMVFSGFDLPMLQTTTAYNTNNTSSSRPWIAMPQSVLFSQAMSGILLTLGLSGTSSTANTTANHGTISFGIYSSSAGTLSQVWTSSVAFSGRASSSSMSFTFGAGASSWSGSTISASTSMRFRISFPVTLTLQSGTYYFGCMDQMSGAAFSLIQGVWSNTIVLPTDLIIGSSVTTTLSDPTGVISASQTGTGAAASATFPLSIVVGSAGPATVSKYPMALLC